MTNNYDSEQYQMLMANFQQLIQTTQDKLATQKQLVAHSDQEKDVQPLSQSNHSPPKKSHGKQSQSVYQSPHRVTYADNLAALERSANRMSPPKKKIAEVIIPYQQINCACGLEDTVKRQQKDIQDLQLRLQLARPLDLEHRVSLENRPVINDEYLQDLLIEISQKNEQLVRLTSLLQSSEMALQQLQQQLRDEQQMHVQSDTKLHRMQQNYNSLHDQIRGIEQREFQISDRLTTEFSDLVIENIKLKERQAQLLAQVNKLQTAMMQIDHRVYVNTFVQTDDQQAHHPSKMGSNFPSKIGSKHVINVSEDSYNQKTDRHEITQHNQQYLNVSLLKETIDEQQKFKSMKQILKEKIEKSLNNTDQFVVLFLEQKKLKNRSQQEVKFYSELGKMLDRIKENYVQLSEAFQTYTQEQDKREDSMKKSLDQTVLSVKLLRENTEIEMQHTQGQLQQKDLLIEQHQTTINDLKNQIKVAGTSVIEAQTHNHALQRENLQLVEKMQDLVRTIEDQTQELQDKQQSIQQIRGSSDTLVKEIRREASELNKAKLQSETNYAHLQFKFEQLQQTLQSQQTNLNEMQNNLDERIHQYQRIDDTLRARNQEVQQLKEQLISLSKELDLVLQQDKRLNQVNEELKVEKFVLYESVEKVQLSQKELYDRFTHLERQYGEQEDENSYLRQHVMRMEESLQLKEQQSDDLQNELKNMHYRLEQTNQERNQFQELSARSQEERNKYAILSKSNEQSQRERSSDLDRYNGELLYKSQTIIQLERDLTNQSNRNTELQSMVQATEQELRMLQDYHDQTINQTEKLKSQVSHLYQQLQEKDEVINQVESHMQNQEMQGEKEKSCLHADYQQRIGMFQSKIMLQEEELKQLQQQLKDSQQQVNFQKSTNWEELLETSYFYNKQSQIKLKVLTQETQRLTQQLDVQRDKNQDLQSFIEKMIENSEENRLLAKEILIEQYEQAQQNQYQQNTPNHPQQSHGQQEEHDQSFNSNETFGRNDTPQTDNFDYKMKTPSNKKNRF